MDFDLPDELVRQNFLMVLEIDRDQTIITANATAIGIFSSNCIGRKIQGLIAELQDGKTWSLTSGLYNFETKSRDPLSMTIVLLPKKDGYNIIGGVSIDEDILLHKELLYSHTSNSNLCRELRRVNEDLNRKTQQRSLLLRFISHDLINMASAISGFTSLCKMTGNDDGSARDKYLHRIAENSEKMISLLRDLSDIAAEREEQPAKEGEALDAREIVQEAVDAMSSQALTKNIRVVTAMPANVARITMEKSKAFRVISNILSNAIKYSQPGAPVTIGVQSTHDEVKITIADSGPGIDATDFANIFLPLWKGKIRPTAGETSTGLGLAIAMRFVEEQNGSIEVSSRVGGGSTFTIHLPVRDARSFP